MTRYLVNNAGNLTEQTTVSVSAGTDDADKIPALNDLGQIDESMLPPVVPNDTTILGAFPGAVAVQVGTLRFYPRSDITINSVFAWLSAPAIEAVVAAIRVNGVIVQTITIPAAADTSTTAVSIAVATTDYITLDIQSGSGNDLTLRLDC